MDLCKIILFVLVLGCLGVSAKSPQLVDSYYTVKEAELLGASLTVATYYYEFDQELYLPSTHICERDELCNNRTTADSCICDYTKTTGFCGAASPNTNDPECCTEDYCDETKYSWTDLKQDVPVFGAVKEGEVLAYRFFLEDVCDKEILVSLDILYGRSWVTTSNVAPVSADQVGRGLVQSPFFSLICPSDPKSTPGTFYASVQGIFATSYYITVTVRDIPETEKFLPSVCSDKYPDHTCLENDVPATGICPEEETFFLYTYTFSGCQQITATLSVFGTGTDADLYASNDPSNQEPYFFTSDYASYLPQNDWVSMSICAPEGETTTLFFNVDCWLAGTDYSNYSFVVKGTDASTWTYTPLTELQPYRALNLLLGASRLETPATNTTEPFSNWLLCENLSYTCTTTWINYPAKDSNIFWPIPPLINSMRLNAIKSATGEWNSPDIYPSEGAKNTYVITLLLSYSINGVPTTLVDSSILDKITIIFLGKLTNSAGEAVSGTYTASQRLISCDYNSFVPLQNEVSSLISDLETEQKPEAINGIRFRFDLLKFSDEYFGCQNLLERLVTTSNQQVITATTGCYAAPGTPEYENDPCCNTAVAGWKATCIPRNQTVSKAASQANSELAAQLCKHSSCVDSYLGDYAQVVDQYAQCSAGVYDTAAENFKVYSTWRECKTIVQDKVCYNDSDCSLPWGQYECNILTRVCNVPRLTQEEEFAKCIIGRMDKYVELYIKSSLNLTARKNDPSYLNSFIAALQTPNCIQVNGTGLNLNARKRYQLKIFDDTCASSCAVPAPCEDKTCLLEESFCYTYCRSKVLSPVDTDETQCTQDLVCNWNDNLCQNLNMTTCQENCGSDTFCGYCSDSKHCEEFSSVSVATCNSETVCILPNGTHVVGLSDAECSSYGLCSQKCPVRCESPVYSPGMCYNSLSETACTSDGGFYDTASSLCIYTADSAANCAHNWFMCTNLDLEVCAACQDGDCGDSSADSITKRLAIGAKCYVNTQVECMNKTECESSGGVCSDLAILYQDDQYGACVLPRQDPTGSYAGYAAMPLCTRGTPFPNGCVDFTVGKDLCGNLSGTWWTPTQGSQQCLSTMGCLDIRKEVFPVGLQFSFSPKSRVDCESEYNVGGSWAPYFSWSQGVWVTGINRKLSVVERKVYTQNDWAPAMDYNKLQTLYFEGAAIKSAIGSKSEALCQTTRGAQTLTSVACDCSDVTGTECFSDSKSTVVAQGKICEGSASDLLTPDANLFFSNTSVPADCVDVLLSSVAASNFRATDTVKLSGDFASFKDTEDYAVKNENGAIIGDIIGDGTILNPSTEVNDFILCLETRVLSSNHEDHPVADFAIANDDLSTLIPQEMSVYVNGSALCSRISITKQVTYFPINRLADWKTPSYRLFDSTALGLIYTLAALFTLVSLIAGIRLVFVLKELVLRTTALKQEHIVVIFIFLFNFIRMVYFYLLPNGDQTPINDYVLVVLPTFFFFTAFTAIIVIWMALSSGKLSSDREAFTRLVNRTALVLNIILYLFFIFIVLLFNFTVNLSKGDCPGRVQSDLEKQVKIQSIISIVYSVVIAVISLIMSAAFIYFGYRLIKMLHVGMKYRKLSMATAISGGGFLLHCVFVITVSSLNRPNIVFSFVGLIITELLPSLFILLLFLPQRATKFKPFASSNQGNSMDSSMSTYKSKDGPSGPSGSASPNV